MTYSCRGLHSIIRIVKGEIMKIDRQIGILSVLLQKETVTAPYLAEKFEVSRRTINWIKHYLHREKCRIFLQDCAVWTVWMEQTGMDNWWKSCRLARLILWWATSPYWLIYLLGIRIHLHLKSNWYAHLLTGAGNWNSSIILQKESLFAALSHIIWFFGGQAGMYGDGV